MLTNAPALPTGYDALIPEAKHRMRRRRVVMALFVLLAGAAVLTFVLRPLGAPGTGSTHGTRHDAHQDALAHLTVPVDAAERTWRAGIKHSPGDASGLTVRGVTQLHHEVVAVAKQTGATVVRIRVWSTPGTAEVVLATRTNPAEYLTHRANRLVRLLYTSYPYVKVVNGRGSSFFEWYRLPSGHGIVDIPWDLMSCSPIGWYTGDASSPLPPCPAR